MKNCQIKINFLLPQNFAKRQTATKLLKDNVKNHLRSQIPYFHLMIFAFFPSSKINIKKFSRFQLPTKKQNRLTLLNTKTKNLNTRKTRKRAFFFISYFYSFYAGNDSIPKHLSNFNAWNINIFFFDVRFSTAELS